ncbi:MAG: extracellular solute-binding protein [Euzebyales bacterium]|nr:extracellular solute-binding protein [Euzebyales bacterium]
MHSRLTRRELLRRGAATGVALAGGSLLAACASLDAGGRPAPASEAGAAPQGGGDFAGETITLLVYSGLTEQLYREHFVPQFSRRTGAEVTVDAAWTEGIARLQQAPAEAPPFDLVLTDPTQGFPAIEAGLFQSFDTGKVPNAERFAPQLLDTEVWRDGNGLPFHSSAMTLGTNTELRDRPYDTWAELLDDRPDQGVMLYNLPYMSLYTFAAMKAERENAVGQAAQMMRDDLDGVLAFAVEHRDVATYFWPSTTDGVNALVRGEVAAGNIHGNGLLAPIRDGEPVAGVIPPGDIAYAQLFFAVPSGVRNLDLSLAAMDHIASEEFQAALASSGEYAAAIPSVAEEQAASDEVWDEAFPSSESDFAALSYYPYDVIVGEADRIAEVWDADVLRGA